MKKTASANNRKRSILILLGMFFWIIGAYIFVMSTLANDFTRGIMGSLFLGVLGMALMMVAAGAFGRSYVPKRTSKRSIQQS